MIKRLYLLLKELFFPEPFREIAIIGKELRKKSKKTNKEQKR
jgi:hypothetical protein